MPPPGERFVRHLPVDADLATPMGKVGGVLTGVRHASHERIVIADDDVRYDAATLAAVAGLLDAAHVVRPQNVFRPLPWHARWDTARTLLNRATGGDWPGTLGVRRSALSGDGRLRRPRAVREPRARPDGRRGRRDRARCPRRVRRAAAARGAALSGAARAAGVRRVRTPAAPRRPARAPAGGRGARRRATVARRSAQASRPRSRSPRSGGGAPAARRVFPADTPLWAPLWLAERAVCSPLAVASRVRWGGVRYGGRVLRLAATPMRALRRRHAGSITATSMGLNEPLFDSSAEQAVTPTTRSISARSSR